MHWKSNHELEIMVDQSKWLNEGVEMKKKMNSETVTSDVKAFSSL
jgi:hypothetical protein